MQLSVIIKNQLLIRITGAQMATTVLQVIHHFSPSLLGQNNSNGTNQPFHVQTADSWVIMHTNVLSQLNSFATDVTLWATDKRTVVHDGN